jgi:hypothetical protein
MGAKKSHRHQAFAKALREKCDIRNFVAQSHKGDFSEAECRLPLPDFREICWGCATLAVKGDFFV